MKDFWLPKNKVGFDRISLTDLGSGDCLFIWPAQNSNHTAKPVMVESAGVHFGFKPDNKSFQIDINSIEGGSRK